jgi:pimeloyl-ACP methyl ester carboxylesterase
VDDEEVVMHTVTTREKVEFRSGGQRCVAWHYPGTNGGCVIMAGGLAVPKEPATDLFARRFNAAGFTVLAFDYRRLGESDGRPRLVVRIGDAQADWHAAIAFARTLPDVDPGKVALWAFSASGGHLFPVAARDPELAAVIAQTPLADAPAVAPALARYSTPRAQLRLMGRGMLDALRGLLRRDPLLVPLVGRRGTVAVLSTPDALEGDAALKSSRYPDWEQRIAARSVLRLGWYRPGRHARRVRCPLLVVVCDDDRAAPPSPAIRVAQRAPRGEVARLPGGHYAPFMEAHERAVELQLAFLERHLLDRSSDQAPAGISAATPRPLPRAPASTRPARAAGS